MPRLYTMCRSSAYALLVCLTALGCTSTPQQRLTIHDSLRGMVYLEKIPDNAVQATHPIALNTDTIARTLRGIYVRENRTTMQGLLTSVISPSTAKRVFSDEDVDFLTPLIASAFTKAAADQWIGFRIPSTESPKESISGVLFVYGRSLQFNLTRLPPAQGASMVDSPPNRYYSTDASGLTGRDLVFVPKEAQRADFKMGDAETPTLVVDYKLLATLPEQPATVPGATSAGAPSASPPVAAPGTTSDMEAVKESLAKKDAEVEALKKEVEAIKQQLNEQPKPVQPRPKSKPTDKSQEPTP